MSALRHVAVDDAARLTPLGESGPVAVRFVPGLDALAYLKPEDDGTVHSLWLHPLDGAPPRRLLKGEMQSYSAAEVLRRERGRIVRDVVTAYQVVGSAAGPVFLARTGAGVWRGGAAGAFAPWPALERRTVDDVRLLPGGDRVLYAADQEIGVADRDGRERRVDRAEADGLSVGLADYAAAEELGRQEALWPSPDGLLLAYARVDARPVAPFEIVHSAEAVPWTERIRYPFAGAPAERVELWLADLEPEGAPPRRLLDVGPERYLVRVAWTPAGEVAALMYSRDQHACAWHILSPQGDAPRLFGGQTSAHWIEIPVLYRFLADGTLLTTRELGGHSHLARVGADGTVHMRTSGDWDVTALCDVDEERGTVVLQATARQGLDRCLVCVDLEDGALRPLVAAPGTHSAVFAPDHRRFVLQSASREHPTETYLCAADGARVKAIHVDPGASAETLGLAPPRLVEIRADDGTPLNGALYLPAGERARPRPAVISVYGGPHAQRVREDWSLTADLRAQHLAQQGFVVLKLDNRGSDGRGGAFARAVERAFATVELDDQVAGVRWLTANHAVDPARVGIYGWSYGGFMTLHAMLQRPDVFRAGVSGAPVTDFRRYDTAYTERHLGMPDESPAAYERACVLAHAADLRGDLLIIHGLVDENVHFAHTARLVRALMDAGRPFELAMLPTSRHMPRDMATRRFVERRTVGWLVEKLGPGAVDSSAQPDEPPRRS